MNFAPTSCNGMAGSEITFSSVFSLIVLVCSAKYCDTWSATLFWLHASAAYCVWWPVHVVIFLSACQWNILLEPTAHHHHQSYSSLITSIFGCRSNWVIPSLYDGVSGVYLLCSWMGSSLLWRPMFCFVVLFPPTLSRKFLNSCSSFKTVLWHGYLFVALFHTNCLACCFTLDSILVWWWPKRRSACCTKFASVNKHWHKCLTENLLVMVKEIHCYRGCITPRSTLWWE